MRTHSLSAEPERQISGTTTRTHTPDAHNDPRERSAKHTQVKPVVPESHRILQCLWRILHTTHAEIHDTIDTLTFVLSDNFRGYISFLYNLFTLARDYVPSIKGTSIVGKNNQGCEFNNTDC